MKKPVIICVDDEPAVLESLKIELKRALGEECIIETAEGGKDALELMDELRSEDCEVALVLSDYIMPDIKGDELLKRMHEMSPNTMKIMLTGQANLDAVSDAIRYARLYRYIPKPWQPEDLKMTVVEAVHSYLQDKKLAEQNLKLQQLNQELERLVRAQADIISERTAQLEKVNEELKRLAHTDSLTQLPNRRRFDEYLSQEWLKLAHEHKYLSLILCDIDFFKLYNDEYGHQAGDECLRRIAISMLLAIKEPQNLLVRYGGEEFVVVLPNTNSQTAASIATELRKAISALAIPHTQSSISQYVTISIGIASLIPSQSLSPLVLFNVADQALYEAKRQGRDRIIVKAL